MCLIDITVTGFMINTVGISVNRIIFAQCRLSPLHEPNPSVTKQKQTVKLQSKIQPMSATWLTQSTGTM